MDIFQVVSDLQGVKRVTNLYPEICQKTINLIFFVCPTTKKRLKINRNHTGFVIDYKKEDLFGVVAWERVQIVKRLLCDFIFLGIDFTCTCVFASGDALIVPALPVEPPACSVEIEGMKIVSNYELVLSNFSKLNTLYEKRPWESIPNKIRQTEKERLFEILPRDAEENLKVDFLERIWVGFALDGIMIRGGVFGRNPVILGVESPGVAMLQNSALDRKDWIPVIQF